jgi:hypothetical protein
MRHLFGNNAIPVQGISPAPNRKTGLVSDRIGFFNKEKENEDAFRSSGIYRLSDAALAIRSRTKQRQR